MRTVISVIGLTFLLPVFSLAQQYRYVPFPDSGAIWSERYQSDDLGNVYERFALSGEDTVIDNKMYKKLYIFYDTVFNRSNASCIGGIREDSLKRIYYRGKTIHRLKPSYINMQVGAEMLLYDFLLNIGDTSRTDNLTLGDENLVVKDIDTILIGNTLRKKYSFTFEDVNYPIFVQWIEGIGNLRGLLFSSGDLPTGGENGYLICFKQNDTILYFNDAYDDCMPVIQGVQTKENAHTIRVFPNPAGHSVSLSFERAISQRVDFFLYDASGRKVQKSKTDKNIKQRNKDQCGGFGQRFLFL